MKVIHEKNNKGVSLVELMVTLVIFSIIVGMIYSVNNAFIKNAAVERKTAKTEQDVLNVSWPLIKEIESAGFGIPSSGACTPAISASGNTLTIHSTASGDSEHAGKWSYITGTNCTVSGLPSTTGENNVVIVNALDRSRLGLTTVTSSNVLQTCDPTYVNNIAFWSPYAGNLECYETSYTLYSGTAPATCAPGTFTLGRRVTTTAGGGTNQPVLDCVLAVGYRFGCIDSTNGNLIWQTGDNCGANKLRMVRIGIIVQSSLRRDFQVPATVELFEDLGSALEMTVNLTNDQRFYKWREIEQTITLRNLE